MLCVGGVAGGREREAVGDGARSQFPSGRVPDPASGRVHAGLAAW